MDTHLLSLTFSGHQGKALILLLQGLGGKLLVSTALNYGESRIGVCQGGSIAEALNEWQRLAEKLTPSGSKEMFGPLGDGGITCLTATTYDTPERIPALRTPDVPKGVAQWIVQAG